MRTVCAEGTELLQFHAHPLNPIPKPTALGEEERRDTYSPSSLWEKVVGGGGTIYSKTVQWGCPKLTACIRLGRCNQRLPYAHPQTLDSFAGFSNMARLL